MMVENNYDLSIFCSGRLGGLCILYKQIIVT